MCVVATFSCFDFFPHQVHLTTERNTNESDTWIEYAIASGEHDELAQNNATVMINTILLGTIGCRVHYSDCPIGHQRDALCCKTGMMLENFYRETTKRRLKLGTLYTPRHNYCDFVGVGGIVISMMTSISISLHWFPSSRSTTLNRTLSTSAGGH